MFVPNYVKFIVPFYPGHYPVLVFPIIVARYHKGEVS